MSDGEQDPGDHDRPSSLKDCFVSLGRQIGSERLPIRQRFQVAYLTVFLGTVGVLLMVVLLVVIHTTVGLAGILSVLSAVSGIGVAAGVHNRSRRSR